MTDKPQPPVLGLPAPGLVWRLRSDGWLASWQARTDRVKDGYSPRYVQLWVGETPTEDEAVMISTRCQHQQYDMLTFGRELPKPQPPEPDHFTGSLRSLIHCYKTDADSPFQKNRFHVKQNRNSLMRRLVDQHGDVKLSEIKARILLAWHKDWAADGKIATGSAFIGQLRSLFSFGATLLEDPECERLCGVMSKMRFQGAKPRTVSVTADYANAIRIKAREHFGWYSMALAQAFQFDCTFRQKDVIGETVPLSEPGVSAVIVGDRKWLRGIVWQEIDENLILKHITSKKQKLVEIDLKLAPMVLEELQILIGEQPLIHVDETTKKVTVNRSLLPSNGPIIINDVTGLPWSPNEYRRKWRLVATKAEVPKNVWNMDSRSGAISEGFLAGARGEFVQMAATHSDISQTADYARIQAEATAEVMRLRAKRRNEPKTE
ncbi:hypothetical protein ACWAT4_21815 [Bradyrhizobium manausense]